MSNTWNHKELALQYIGLCRDPSAADFAAEALRHYRIIAVQITVQNGEVNYFKKINCDGYV